MENSAGGWGGVDHVEPPRCSCLLSEYASKHRIIDTITVSGEAHSTQHRSQKCHVQISTLLPLAVSPKTLISLWINGDNNDTHQCRVVLRLNEMIKYTVEYCAVLCLVTQSCPTLCDPMNCSPPGSSIHGNSLGKNTGVGCRALRQGILPTRGSKSCLPHCKQILHHLSHQGSPQWNITQS